MNQSLLIASIFTRLRRYKLKSLFMGLGITISVLATVLLQTASISVRQAFTTFVGRMYPADSVVLMAGTGFMGGSTGRRSLKLADVETVARSIGVTEWDPVVFAGSRDVNRAGNNLRVGVAGYSDRAERVRGRGVQDGAFFTAADVTNKARVALIGSTTARTLFGAESPLGAQIFIDNVPFQVNGILETIGADPHGGDQDNQIYVPYTTLMEQMLRVEYVSGAAFIVSDRTRSEAVKREIIDVMRQQHHIGEGQVDDFTVITPVQMNAMVDSSFRTFNVFIPLISVTAFLISAAVIVGIMQISIKARTAEFGLRKAVGARARDVQLQIVLEVVMVSLVASAVGIALAIGGSAALAPTLAAKFGVKQVSPQMTLMLGAVAAAMVTGLLGGVLPARRAAKLNPVEALK